jgi:SAM-dependent methyltransferase
MESEQTFFDFAAEVGLTKHLGGLWATEEMVKRCRIGPGKTVLDVGCGAGVTSCYLAKQHGCKVVGVDILSAMVERSRERASREKLSDRVEFRVADAQDLPFEDKVFDAVITESVTAFPEDKQKAVREYARVTKPGGFVGLNESTWLKYPPPPEIEAWTSQEIGATVTPLTADGWRRLLEGAGLEEIEVLISPINIKNEAHGLIQRYGCGGMLEVMFRGLRMYLRNPFYRRFVKRVQKEGVQPDNLTEYFGFGIYVGIK